MFLSLRRAFTTTLRVPAPVAAGALLALVVLSALVFLRPAPTNIVLAAPPQVESLAPARIVEVPVAQERIVTRIVYVAQRNAGWTKRAPQTTQAAGAQMAG